MNWNILEQEAELDMIDQLSADGPVMIFKHSTRCGISQAALGRIERDWKDEETGPAKAYFLNLLAFRPLSALIAQRYGIEHESPQVLVIREGKCVYHESHYAIRYEDVKAAILAAVNG